MHFQTPVCFIFFTLLALTQVSLQSVSEGTTNPYGGKSAAPEPPCDKTVANVPAYVPPKVLAKSVIPEEPEEEECGPETYVNPYTTPVTRALAEPKSVVAANPTPGGYGTPDPPCNCNKKQAPKANPVLPGYTAPKTTANPYLGTTSVDGKGSDDDDEADSDSSNSNASKESSDSDSESNAFKLTSSGLLITAVWVIAAFGWA